MNIIGLISWKMINTLSSNKVQSSNRIIPSEMLITSFQKSEMTYFNPAVKNLNIPS